MDAAHGTITLPLYQGKLAHTNKNVWYILTDVSDSNVAAALGLNFSTKLQFSSIAARTGNLDAQGNIVVIEPHYARVNHFTSAGQLVDYVAENVSPEMAFLDQLDGAAEHATQHLNLAIVAKAPLPRVLTFAEERGWRRLRFLSSARNTYNRDYLAETSEGAQRPMLTVFQRHRDEVRHFWSSELFYAPWDPGQDPRHVGTLEPVWNLFDLTPKGRPDWDEQLSYE